MPEDYNSRGCARCWRRAPRRISLIPCNSVFRGYDMDECHIELLGTCGTVINTCGPHGPRARRRAPRRHCPCAHERPHAVHAAGLRCWPRPSGAACRWTRSHRHLEPERLLSHFVANHMFFRLALPGARRILVDHIASANRPRAALEPAVRGRPAHAAGGRHAGRGHGLHAELGRSSTPRTASRAAWTPTTSCRASPSSSTSRSASSRRWPSSAPAAASGPRSRRERFGAKDPRSWRFKFHGQTSGVDLTRQQPLNNIARVTVQAMAGILGGLQSLHTDAYDEALSVPTETARASPSPRRTSCARKPTSPT